jgi:hypothetical protein
VVYPSKSDNLIFGTIRTLAQMMQHPLDGDMRISFLFLFSASFSCRESERMEEVILKL